MDIGSQQFVFRQDAVDFLPFAEEFPKLLLHPFWPRIGREQFGIHPGIFERRFAEHDEAGIDQVLHDGPSRVEHAVVDDDAKVAQDFRHL